MTSVNSTNTLAYSGEKLPTGERDRIAEKHGVSPQYVTMVKNGTRNNTAIMDDIICAIESGRLKRAELQARIKLLSA